MLILAAHASAKNPYPIHDDAQDLRKLLGSDWLVVEAEDFIRIESVFKVHMVGVMSRPAIAPPDFADTVTEQALEKEGPAQNYVITLKYSLPLADAEYEARLKERTDAINILRRGTKTKTDFDNATDKLKTLQVPRYRHGDYDVCRTLPDSVYSQIYPPEAFRKVAAAKALIDVKEGFYPYDDL
ncbi:hypothetical protein CfE428DRAFT_3439 [Chthoniobacter flavus Ellin428]|uniref:Uncharacterized protein n=1 Tax=Chthoniobacter flavus Ellin428 TaxID=497964 RepID=B4D3F1_9BACT|nr:hypothetical protein [Chthoniobacter flavus]EDY19262.1 hypothetical protein CfE428DRAFT_3439 [Chthoniobacter flavus Ellin428]TCO88104.1 hypothetical protein EV701_119148 [Chthoniobacter flavus]